MGIYAVPSIFFLLLQVSLSSGQTVYKVTTILEEPFVIQKQGGSAQFDGFIPDLLKKIEPLLNVTFDMKHVADFKYGSKRQDGNWTGLIGELVKGTADIAAASLTVTAERAKAIDLSHPFMESGLSIVLKRPNTRGWHALKGFVTFLEPFAPGVWITLLVACLIVPVLYGVVIHFDPMEDEADPSMLRNIARAVPVIFYRFCLQGSLAPANTTSRASRVLIAFWSLFLVILYVTWATSYAVYMLRGERQTPSNPIHSFEGLASQSGIKFGTVNGGATYRYFTEAKDEVDKKIGKHLKDNPDQMTSSSEDGIKRVRDSGGAYAFIMEEIPARLTVGKLPCDLMLVHHSSIRKTYSFGCTANTTICRNLDVAIIQLKTDGEIQELIDKWLKPTGDCDTDFYDDYLAYMRSFNMEKDASGFLFQSDALTMEKVGSMFILLAVGIAVSIALLVFDVCTERRVQKTVNRRGGTDKQPFEAITDDMQ